VLRERLCADLGKSIKKINRTTKSEIRNTKSETNSNVRIKKPKHFGFSVSFAFWDLEFVSDFEIRDSDFAFPRPRSAVFAHLAVTQGTSRKWPLIVKSPARCLSLREFGPMCPGGFQ
jgi:hypothetical protein